MRSVSLLALLLAPLLVVSCGGSSDPRELTDEGNQAIGADDYGTALDAFEKALEVIGDDTSHAQYLAASLGAIEARTKSDPAAAIADLTALAAALPGKVTDRDYSRVASRLGALNKLTDAIAVVELGRAAFPGAESLDKQVTKLGEQAETSGTPEEVEALRSLGYMGGD